MTNTGEDPRDADSTAPANGAQPPGRSHVGTVETSGAPHGATGQPAKKKGRRRKKRRPVYANANGGAGQGANGAGRSAPHGKAARPAQPTRSGPPPRPDRQRGDPPNSPARGENAGANGHAVSNVHAVGPAPIRRGDNPVQDGPDRLYAALDLGTNNCRLLIAQPRDRGFRVVDAFSRIVRLGEGVGKSGRLGEAAMDRAVDALRICRSKLADRGVMRTRLIATEACRAAENGELFLERVRVETGLALEIVSRETEARLAVSGCASLIDPNTSGALLFDIGGGSSELVWIDLTRTPERNRRRMSDRIRTWASLPVGVVTLSERHGGERVTPAVFEAMVAEVTEMLLVFPEAAALDQAVAGGNLHMLGTSGTVTTLAGVHLGLPRYDRRKVDGTWMTADEVNQMMTIITGMDYEARIANPCIGKERADLVLAGCAILEAIRRRWPCQRLRVADRGLREGILVEMMAEDGVWRRQPPRQGGRPS
ncbi:Ppx/GppA phosphatase family protein [Kaistia dalseonensis]|uniref:Exopolyphosphatase/guanosine-5'-triphosphate, 3'-diphosphate pyrophosphatase n=1 Tax=Kaistia dalseonensis TaxID=410840 RepID=A0ABU0H225_9HYPH|nr:Ppx/GppA phosphatase family protein [Kaistia dalseonensis]MCX5493790.1 Ppx/GppA phosphatase family protein [Kaistia dalseonensis]MDQ0436355.1 exopolyphosphatase/guanosine-5'-triphosphate,3'-diphosphate pyrophosphatase [Kaistia dalseonensis]